ncbi:MAG: OmpA family protein, partial [Saprospiraceae bacterium]|nr:OmpA family protein [Saprospiraceae bacterium]
EYLKAADGQGKEYETVVRELKNCMFALSGKKTKDKVLVQSFDETVNSLFDEIKPLQSPQYGNVFYYSTNGIKGDLDIHSSFINDKGQWEQDSLFNSQISSPDQETIHDISGDGMSMVYDLNHKGGNARQYYVSCYREGERHIIPLPDEVFSMVEDVQILSDTSLVFASSVLPGEGGYDLFSIEYKNGEWSRPINMGPQVNSPHDERSPFMSADKNQIYFSSNRPYCFGGFDIYHFAFESGTLEHLNEPVNGPGNDLGFRFQSDNQMALFYSDRKTGEGGFDIYFTYLKERKKFNDKDSASIAFVEDYFKMLEKKKKEREALSEKKKNEQQEKEEKARIKEEAERAAEEEREKEIAAKKKEHTKEKEDQSKNTAPVEAQEERSDYMIFYQDRYDLTHGKNKEELDLLIDLMNERNMNIRIIAHTDHLEPGLTEFVQYNSLKRARTVAEYFIENGVKPDRISFESVAYNFPIAKREIAGNINNDYLFYNRRIDFEFYNSKNEILISPDFYSLDLPAYASDRKHVLYSDIREELYYSIWIGSSERMFKNAVLRLYQDIYIRRESFSDLNNYYCGFFTSYEEAKAQMEMMKEKSNLDFRVQAFYNGHKPGDQEIEQLAESYPDLKTYIKAIE